MTRKYSPLRYAGLFLAPEEGFGLWQRLFLARWARKELLTLFVLVLGHVWCSVVTSVTFSSNVSNFEQNPKNPKMSNKIKKSNNFKKTKKTFN